jgi:hypothetical protein
VFEHPIGGILFLPSSCISPSIIVSMVFIFPTLFIIAIASMAATVSMVAMVFIVGLVIRRVELEWIEIREKLDCRQLLIRTG